MKKLILSVLLVFAYLPIQAQEVTPKTLDISITANTGNVNPHALPLFAVNFVKYGLKYTEGVNSWFSYYMLMELKTDFSFCYTSDGLPTKIHQWNLDEYLIEGGMHFGNNFVMAFNNLGRFDFELYHQFRLPNIQILCIGTELELMVLGGKLFSGDSVVNKDDQYAQFDPVARPSTDYVVHYFGMHITYINVFKPNWIFISQLNPRFMGDTSTEFKELLQLRWNNGIIYNAPNGWSINGIVRYQVHKLHTSDPLHNVMFIGGITKKLNFSQL